MVQLVRMTRHGDGKTADVHPDEVRGMRGWYVDDTPAAPAYDPAEAERDRQAAMAATAEGEQLQARHQGFGRFAIYRGEEVVLAGIDKAVADHFNALDPASRRHFVVEHAHEA